MNNFDWQAANHAIIDALDIRAEYAALGVSITGQNANAKGWLQCSAIDREDSNPSAGINIGGEHPARGRYKDFAGDNLSLFEFAAKHGQHQDWQAARKHYAQITGIELPAKRQPEPDSQLDWRPYSAAVVRGWCETKGGITEASVRAAGGRLAAYPKKTGEQDVICLPVYGAAGIESDICNWVMWRVNGADLRLYQGKDVAPKLVKNALQNSKHGASAGWIGQWGLRHLEQAELVWKTEGISDLLALQSAIGASGDPRRHVAITNSNGCMHVFEGQPEYLKLLAGKRVNVLHDCDEPGQAGAKRWCNALVQAGAKEVRNVLLPYEVKEKSGKDVRDFLRGAEA